MRRQDFIDQADFQRGICIKWLTQKQQLRCALVAKNLWRQQARGIFWAYAQIDEGHRKSRVIAGQHHFAVQQQRGAYAYRWPTNGGNDGLGKCCHGEHKLKNRRFDLRGRVFQKIRNVVARREDIFSPLQHRHAHLFVLCRVAKNLRQLAIHGAVERVFTRFAVKGDGQNTVLGVLQNFAHTGLSSKVVKVLRL